MLSYLIMDAREESSASYIERVAAGDIVARIDELSGRNIGGYIVGTPVRRTGGAYVAVHRDSTWRMVVDITSPGFYVRKVNV